MRKIFLTSGLVLCMVGSNAFAATDIDANGNVGGSAATCVYNVLDTYEGSSSFDAKWTPNNYTITFAKNTVDTNGATLVAQDGTTATPTGTMADQTYAYDSTANLTANAYSITGYNFDGWSTTTNPTNVNGGNATLTNAQSVTYVYPGNATLTARWDPAQSGAITLNSSVYPGNDTNQTPLYTTSTSEAVTAPTTTTVYSVYNNGLYSDSNGATPVVAANLIPSKDGYTFGGFYNSAGSTQYINSSGAVQDAAKRAVTTGGGTDTWYANWAPNLYEITYNPGTAGTQEVSGKSVTKAVYYDATTYSDDSTLATLAGNTFLITGYSFAGWSSDHNVTTGANTTTLYNANTAISPYKVVGDTEMTAQWNPICYGAITLDSKKYSSSDDNTGVSPTSATSPSSIYVLYDNGIYTDNACTSTTGLTNGNITIPTLTGYNFTGFYDSKNSAVNNWIRNRVIDQTGAITATGYGSVITETTWYAGWSPNDYTITFAKNTADVNGTALVAQNGTTATPTGTMSPQTYTYDSTANLTSNAYSITGYNFDGWSTTTNPANVNGGNATLTNAQSVTYTYPDDVTLTARWDPVKSGAITLNSNIYPNNDNTQTALYTVGNGVTASTTATVYSKYNTGLYSDSNGTTAVVAANLIPSKTGYTFGGYKNAAGTTLYINSSGAVQDVAKRAVTTGGGTDTWYANWTPKRYSVRYSTCANGGGSDHRDFEAIEYDGSYTILGLDAVNLLDGGLFIDITPSIGYHVSQWTDGTNNYAPGDIISQYTTDSALFLTAVCAPNVHTITYGCGSAPTGASTSVSGTAPAAGSATFDSTYTLSATYGDCALTGYSATGWDCTGGATLTNATGEQSALTNDADIACTAHWTANNYTITFARNQNDMYGNQLQTPSWGSSFMNPAGSTASQTFAYDSTANLNENGYFITGYVFDGWTTTTDVQSVNGGNASYTDGQSVTYRYQDNATLTAKWRNVLSGPITLDSSIYPNNDRTQTVLYTTSTGVTAPQTQTVYSRFARGLYSNAEGTTSVVSSKLIPSKTGYTFNGFKNPTSPMLINGSGTVQFNAKKAVQTEGGTDTWYAQWTPNVHTITYSCGSVPSGSQSTLSGNGPSDGSATYDSTYDLSATYGTCALPGYHATGWDCSGGATLSNANGTQSALATDSDIACNVHWVANNIITNWDGNVGTIGTSGSQSCDYDGDITLPSSVTRPGFVLNGWTVTNSATLPSGYTRLDYIESTGTQYIDTDVSGFDSGNWEIYAKWMITEWTSFGTVFGVYDGNYSNTYTVRLQNSNNNAYQITGNTTSNSTVAQKPKNVIHTATVRTYSSGGGFDFDGQNYAYSSGTTTGTALNSTTKMALFAITGGGSKSKARIYTAWAKKDGVWQYNMIPARRDSDNVLGMYDIVNDVFKTNAGTGTFVAGPPAQ